MQGLIGVASAANRFRNSSSTSPGPGDCLRDLRPKALPDIAAANDAPPPLAPPRSEPSRVAISAISHRAGSPLGQSGFQCLKHIFRGHRGHIPPANGAALRRAASMPSAAQKSYPPWCCLPVQNAYEVSLADRIDRDGNLQSPPRFYARALSHALIWAREMFEGSPAKRSEPAP